LYSIDGNPALRSNSFDEAQRTREACKGTVMATYCLNRDLDLDAVNRIAVAQGYQVQKINEIFVVSPRQQSNNP
jgi:hypothetical protein